MSDEIWPNELMIRDTKIVPDDGGGRIYTTAGFGYVKEKYIRESLVVALRAELAEAKAERDAALLRLDARERAYSDLSQYCAMKLRELETLTSKLDSARHLLEKIATAVNDPLLSQRVRISIASDIAAYLETKP